MPNEFFGSSSSVTYSIPQISKSFIVSGGPIFNPVEHPNYVCTVTGANSTNPINWIPKLMMSSSSYLQWPDKLKDQLLNYTSSIGVNKADILALELKQTQDKLVVVMGKLAELEKKFNNSIQLKEQKEQTLEGLRRVLDL